MRPGELDALMRELVESTPDAILIVDEEFRIALANSAAGQVFGFTANELDRSPIECLIPLQIRARHRAQMTGFMCEPRERPMGASMELRGLRKDGGEFQAQISLRPLRTASGRMLVAVVVRDVTELRRAQVASAWLTAVVQSTGDAIIGLTEEGKIASWNPGAERLFGYSPAEVLGREEEILAASERRAEQKVSRLRALAGESTDQFETECVRKDAGNFPVSITTSPIRDAQDQVIGVAAIVRDITDRRLAERELKFFAEHDSLTGLYNRRRLIDELERHVAEALRYPHAGGALLIADLDNFKQINDTLGHKAGDELLRALANVLLRRLRDTDMLGRIGGDEFAVLLPRAEIAQAAGVAESLRAAIDEFEMVIDGRHLRTTASIGVAPIDAELSPIDVLAAADIAMYEAKGRGHNRVAVARPDPDSRPARGWSERVAAALREDRFELYAQPIVGIARPEDRRCELLLRLREGDELISPAAFLYAAERFHLIEQIDQRVISGAIALITTDREERVHYHVNLSGASIVEPATLDYLGELISTSGVDPARLTIEITESAASTDLDYAQRFARRLRGLGCTLALDDFGSGFGSFSYLRRVPVQFLKIDGSFITGLAQSSNDRSLVKAIVDLAHGLGAAVIAKHVNAELTRAILERYEADYIQGYHFGLPAPIGHGAIAAMGTPPAAVKRIKPGARNGHQHNSPTR